MRREGRMHGSYVRESKHTPWAVKAPTKPTGHSRCTGKCPGNNPRCKLCTMRPVAKSKDKIKGGLKAKSFNITSNYKMQEWRVCDSSPPSTSKKPILKVEHPLAPWQHDADFDYSSDMDVEESFENGVEIEEPDSWKSGIVLPIETLLRARKIREEAPESVSDDLEESANDVDESADYSDESWSGIDFSDGEDVSDGEESWADDWSLVEGAM